jgi:hypothetical protein
MWDYAIGVFWVLFGLYAIATRSLGARQAVRWNALFGLKYDEKPFRIGGLIGGLFFVGVGVIKIVSVLLDS